MAASEQIDPIVIGYPVLLVLSLALQCNGLFSKWLFYCLCNAEHKQADL